MTTNTLVQGVTVPTHFRHPLHYLTCLLSFWIFCFLTLFFHLPHLKTVCLSFRLPHFIQFASSQPSKVNSPTSSNAPTSTEPSHWRYISTNQPQPLKLWWNKLKINQFAFFRFVRPSDWLLLLLRMAFSCRNVEEEKKH